MRTDTWQAHMSAARTARSKARNVARRRARGGLNATELAAASFAGLALVFAAIGMMWLVGQELARDVAPQSVTYDAFMRTL